MFNGSKRFVEASINSNGSVSLKGTKYSAYGSELIPVQVCGNVIEATDGWWISPRNLVATDVVGSITRPLSFFYQARSFAQSGADPEVFSVDADGTIIPAFDFLPSKGTSPRIYWDGYQGEFTIDPTHCHQEAVISVQERLRAIHKKLLEHNPKAKLSWDSVLEIPKARLAGDQRKHVELGCSPSFNVYSRFDDGSLGFHEIEACNPRELDIRFAGFHFHSSALGKLDSEKDADRLHHVVSYMDAIAGVGTVLMLRGMEDVRRRQFYGRAGEIRLPPWGLEYRVPSAAVLAHPIATMFLFDLCRASMFLGNISYYTGLKLWDFDAKVVQHIINTYDVRAARSLFNKNTKALDLMMRGLYVGNTVNNAKALLYVGVKKLFATTGHDVVTNWQLETRTNRVSFAEKTPFQVSHLRRDSRVKVVVEEWIESTTNGVKKAVATPRKKVA